MFNDGTSVRQFVFCNQDCAIQHTTCTTLARFRNIFQGSFDWITPILECHLFLQVSGVAVSDSLLTISSLLKFSLSPKVDMDIIVNKQQMFHR